MYWLKRYKWGILCVILVMANVIWFMAINKPSPDKTTNQFRTASASELAEGKVLVAQYCQTCHMQPDPSLLDKTSWNEGVLTRMGPFLGYKSFHGKPYYRANDVGPGYFPDKPIIDSVKWQRIIDYFTTLAPDTLPGQHKTTKLIRSLPFFSVEVPSNPTLSGKVSIASYVKMDTSVTPRRLFVNDGVTNHFILLDNKLQIANAVKTNGPVVDVNFQFNNILVCSIGKTLMANNLKDGNITAIQINKTNKITSGKTSLFKQLARPVKVTSADLNGDGKTDYVISEFGNLVGKLSWMENKGGGKFISHTLRQRPGALTTIIEDVNHDGKPDIWAQFAQGDEGVFLYTNQGNGRFNEREVLRFPPCYGSTSFDVVDMNHDGYPDIVYTCGDNGDYTQVLKPYHGVYIFINDGKNNFTQKYFYPINGCYKAIARDFDGDGNIDIATISFYPARVQPEEVFIYLKNTGGLNFQPYSLPVGTKFQKGLTMDAGDLDGDGKTDLILGNGYFSSDSLSTHQEPLFMVLKNISNIKKH